VDEDFRDLLFYYNTIQAIRCTYEEAKQMPINEAQFYVILDQEIKLKKARDLKS